MPMRRISNFGDAASRIRRSRAREIRPEDSTGSVVQQVRQQERRVLWFTNWDWGTVCTRCAASHYFRPWKLSYLLSAYGISCQQLPRRAHLPRGADGLSASASTGAVGSLVGKIRRFLIEKTASSPRGRQTSWPIFNLLYGPRSLPFCLLQAAKQSRGLRWPPWGWSALRRIFGIPKNHFLILS